MFESWFSRSLPPIWLMVRLAALLLALETAHAAGPAEAQKMSVRLMQSSVEAQRASVASMRRAASRRPPQLSGSAAAAAPARYFRPELAIHGCRSLAEQEVALLAERAAAREGVASDLLRAVIEVESAGLPCAVSRKGALGLMQLMPATALDLDLGNPFDPAENVNAGARYLKQLLLRYGGDLALALGAYNAGPSRVDEAGGVPAIAETIGYVGRVLSRLGLPAPVD